MRKPFAGQRPYPSVIDPRQTARRGRRLPMNQEALDGSASVPGESGNHSRAVRTGREAISAVKLSQRLTAEVDAWAEAHNAVRSDAIRQLLELGLRASSVLPPQEG